MYVILSNETGERRGGKEVVVCVLEKRGSEREWGGDYKQRSKILYLVGA